MIPNEIKQKIESLRREYPFLSREKDDYILNALITQTIFFKSPSHILTENLLKDIIVDGRCDGGIDCILTDLESDFGDIVFVQSKYYEKITLEQIKDALNKMYAAYKNLCERKYNYFNTNLISQYTNCNYEMEADAGTVFYFCTTAPQSGIKLKSIKNHFSSLIGDDNIKLEIYFEANLVEKIIEFDSLRRTVSAGKILIDMKDNFLLYSENNDEESDAIIVNGSAWSIKELYSRHHLALFAQNLRFFVSSRNIDNDIKKSIDQYKKKFWYKNNGITIICEDYDVSGKEIHLQNFSIINGGQTTTLLGKNDSINERNDFYLPIKIIKAQGETQEEKQQFIFDIAIATNSQKAIKPADLKANEPEQVLFANLMRENFVFYRTKRGENIPTDYKIKYKNCDLPKASKIALAGIYLMPGTSRSNPSIIYKDNQPYYEGIFIKNKENSVLCIKDLLYIDYYFDTKFKKEYARTTKKQSRITFANNSRTLCLSFAGFLAKYLNGLISDEQISVICNADFKEEKDVKKVQRVLAASEVPKGIINKTYTLDKDKLDEYLHTIFSFICKQGALLFESSPADEKTDESNWLKKDESFYKIIANTIDDLEEEMENHQEAYQIFKK